MSIEACAAEGVRGGDPSIQNPSASSPAASSTTTRSAAALRPSRLAALSPRALVLALALASTACSVGGGSTGATGPGPGSGGEDGPNNSEHGGGIHGEDGGVVAPGVPNGSVVAVLETEVPDADSFVLRGTFPVPPNTFPRGDGQMAFAIEDWDGTQLETQNEIVTRYASDAAGADVVEVVARVRRDPADTPGNQTQYRVLQVPHAPRPAAGSPDVADLQNGPKDVPASVQTFLGDANSIRIIGTDVFGNEYVVRPLDGTGVSQLKRYGAAHAQLRVYQNMNPSPQVAGPTGTLPHLFGVHSYLGTLQEEELVLLDVRFHNGHSGNDTTSTDDDALDKVYFKKIEIAVPVGWDLLQSFDDPFFIDPYTVGSERFYPLVKPMGDQMHVMRWQAQFHRRLAIAPTGDTDPARRYLDAYGQGFCRRGQAPGGQDLWSWWNPGTARYFPQSYLLPSLEHVGHGSLRSSANGTLGWMTNHLRNGTHDGIYPIQTGALGWGHPWGTSYGGMTSGAEIYMVDGVETAEAASRAGFRVFQGTHRMHTDRMPTAFYDIDGEPSSVESWRMGSGSTAYVPFEFYGTPKVDPFDLFGIFDAPTFHTDHVVANGMQPYYEGAHLGYDPTDLQHYVRYTRSAKVLGWLGNDALAKDDLRMQAENANLSYHQFYSSAGLSLQGTGMLFDIQDVAGEPGIGFGYGRGEAWSLDAMSAAYAFADPAWRATKRPWFDALANLFADGQATCNGFIQSAIRPKFLDGRYRARQAIEQSITENALRGMRETVYRGADNGYTAMLGDVMLDLLFSFISPMAWTDGEPAPWSHSANGPLDLSLPPYCNVGQMPADGFTDVYENYQNWSSFAYGYDLTGSQQFLDKATTQANATNLLNAMHNTGISNIGNQAALIALAQYLDGIL